MSMRVGQILRYEDVHGVSGDAPEGEVVAEVIEFSNGKVVVAWQSKAPSVNTYDNVKYVETTHGHGGKSEIDWIWESEAEADPMDKVFEKKIREAGGDPTRNGNGNGNGNGVALEEVAEDAAEAAAEELTRLVERKTVEKLTERVRETEEAEKREGDKKPAASKKKAAAKKPTNGKKKEQ